MATEFYRGVMPTQTMLSDTTPAGFDISTGRGVAGTLTTRRTATGERIALTPKGAWVPIAVNTMIAIDENSLDGVGGPAWGEEDGCPMGVAMGCDGHPGCIGECGGTLPQDTLVDLDDPQIPAGSADYLAGMSIFSGTLAEALDRLPVGIYPGQTFDGEPVYVAITAIEANAHHRA